MSPALADGFFTTSATGEAFSMGLPVPQTTSSSFFTQQPKCDILHLSPLSLFSALPSPDT